MQILSKTQGISYYCKRRQKKRKKLSSPQSINNFIFEYKTCDKVPIWHWASNGISDYAFWSQTIAEKSWGEIIALQSFGVTVIAFTIKDTSLLFFVNFLHENREIEIIKD